MLTEELQDLAEELRDGQPQEAAREESAPPEEDTPEFYRSQREVDAVIGRRIRQEKERWQRQNADALALYEALGEVGLGEGIALLSAHRFGVTPEDVKTAMEAETPAGDLREAACRCATERKLRAALENLPGADADALLANPAFLALMEVGEPVERAVSYLSLEETIARAKEEAHREALRAIAARQNRPPVLHAPGGAPAYAQVNHLPDAVVKAIDQRLKRGEHVRI